MARPLTSTEASRVDYCNSTSFPSIAFESVDGKGMPFYVAVLGATFLMKGDGQLTRAPEQAPLQMADEFYGEVNKSAVRRESDMAPFKPWCDVIVLGQAQAPGSRPQARFEAGIRITRKGDKLLDKRLMITGPRYWKKGLFGWSLTRPEPITALPLRYEYAYGGECRIEATDPLAEHVGSKHRLTPDQRAHHPEGADQAPIAHSCSPANNLGLGFTEKWYLKAKQLQKIAAPQIEAASDPVLKFGKSYLPQGLGVMGRVWQSRLGLCGTMDQAFLDSGRSLPEDFDFAFWNGAHPDLQLPYLKGGETIDLVNIPITGQRGERTDSQGNGVTRLALPELSFSGVTILADGQMVSYDLNLDTVVIDAEKGFVYLTYRLKLPMNPAIESLEVEPLNSAEKEILKDHVESVNERLRLFQESAHE
jgi:hypothetical protein